MNRKGPSRDLVVAKIQYLETIRSYLYDSATKATVLTDLRISGLFFNFRDQLNNVIDDLYLELD